jgi:ABC-type multidrug transport system fused ATPase/permease subunit
MLSILKILDYKQKIKFLLILIFTFLISVLEIFNVVLLIPLIGMTFDKNYLFKFEDLSVFLKFISETIGLNSYLFLIIFFLLIYIFKTLLYSVLIFISGKFSYVTRAEVAQKVLSCYVYQDYDRYRQNTTAQITNIVRNEVAQFGQSLLALVNLIIHTFIFFCISIFILVNFYFELLVMIFIIIFFSIIYILVFNKSLLNLGNKRFLSETVFFKDLTEILSAFKEIKIYKRESFFLNIFQKNNRSICEIGYKWSFLQSLPRIWIEFVFLIILCSVAISSYLIYKDITQAFIPIGVISFSVLRILPSLNLINSSYQTIIFNRNSCDRIEKIIGEAKYFQPSHVDLNFTKSIKFENLSYTHGENLIFNNINVEIKKGDILGVVGKSGSGKSTFVEILTGLLESYNGRIFCDSKDIKDNVRGWQKNFGYIPQKIYLLNDSIKNNILFGNPILNIKKINSILEKVGLAEFVSNLPNGLETSVGENGSFLSGGQAQRICIARALYHDPNILILDESTNALDVNTENEVLNYVKNLAKDITIIIISHRLDTLKICNVIYRIQDHKLIKL